MSAHFYPVTQAQGSRVAQNWRKRNVNSRDAKTAVTPYIVTAGRPETLQIAVEETSTAVGTAATADISHSKGSKDVNRSKNSIK
jgi:hypothetical protein